MEKLTPSDQLLPHKWVAPILALGGTYTGNSAKTQGIPARIPERSKSVIGNVGFRNRHLRSFQEVHGTVFPTGGQSLALPQCMMYLPADIEQRGIAQWLW